MEKSLNLVSIGYGFIGRESKAERLYLFVKHRSWLPSDQRMLL